MIRKGVIDSLNLSSTDLESLFFDEDNYNIKLIKGIGVFKHIRWVEAFKKPLTQNIISSSLKITSQWIKN